MSGYSVLNFNDLQFLSFALYRFIYVLLRTIKETDIYLLDFKVHVSALVLIYGEIILLCLKQFSIYKVS